MTRQAKNEGFRLTSLNYSKSWSSNRLKMGVRYILQSTVSSMSLWKDVFYQKNGPNNHAEERKKRKFWRSTRFGMRNQITGLKRALLRHNGDQWSCGCASDGKELVTKHWTDLVLFTAQVSILISKYSLTPSFLHHIHSINQKCIGFVRKYLVYVYTIKGKG